MSGFFLKLLPLNLKEFFDFMPSKICVFYYSDYYLIYCVRVKKQNKNLFNILQLLLHFMDINGEVVGLKNFELSTFRLKHLLALMKNSSYHLRSAFHNAKSKVISNLFIT